jgi:type I restriction enzyme S subunit
MSENQEMPKGWAIVKIGDVFDFIGGGTPSKKIERYWNGNISWASVKDVKGDCLHKTEDKITKEGLKNSAANLAYPEDVILITRIIPGRTIISKITSAINQDLKIVKPKFKTSPEFIKLLFNFIERECIKLASGTTVLGISLNNLNEIFVPLPPIPEQQRIVAKIEEMFSSLDKGIESLKTAQQQLKVYRQSVLKWAFEGKLTRSTLRQAQGTVTPVAAATELVEPVAEPVEAIETTDNNGELPKGDALSLPQGWKVVELKEVCEIKRGKSKHRPRNEPSLFGGKYPFIQTGDIRNANGGYIKKFSQTYSEIGLQQSKLWAKGTLCITIAANIGETAILDLDACFPDSVVGLICNEKLLLNKYTNYFFISHKSKLEELAPATAQKNINVDILEKVKIPIPPISEQRAIVAEIESRLSVCDKIEESIEQSLRQSESLRQSILKKAFEGKLVPQDPKDEPASKLLERIKAEKESLKKKK